MKMSKVRRVVEEYSEEQLRTIVFELYKAIPASVKEEHHVDSLLMNPDSLKQRRPKTRQQNAPDIGILKDETEQFVDYAYKQYYFAPNRFVSKQHRPKWRFVVKRLYKGLLAASADEGDVPEAANLLDKLYQLLCYSCDYTLFSAYDSFRSVGIEQQEFFRRVLVLKYQCEDRDQFIRSALLSMVNCPLGRDTLREDLMEVVLEFAKTPDLREMTIAQCTELIEAIRRESLPTKKQQPDYERRREYYEKSEKINDLTQMAFLCYARLHEYPRAISYFKANYSEADPEIGLYVLLRLLIDLHQKDYFLQEYEKGLENGIKPRDTLKKAYRITRETGELPKNIW